MKRCARTLLVLVLSTHAARGDETNDKRVFSPVLAGTGGVILTAGVATTIGAAIWMSDQKSTCTGIGWQCGGTLSSPGPCKRVENAWCSGPDYSVSAPMLLGGVGGMILGMIFLYFGLEKVPVARNVALTVNVSGVSFAF